MNQIEPCHHFLPSSFVLLQFPINQGSQREYQNPNKNQIELQPISHKPQQNSYRLHPWKICNKPDMIINIWTQQTIN